MIVENEKIHDAFKAYIQGNYTSVDRKIRLFLLFDSEKDIKRFKDKFLDVQNGGNAHNQDVLNVNGEEVRVFFTFTVLPCIFIETTIKGCNELATIESIKLIDGSYPAFLSSLNVAAEIGVTEIRRSLLNPTGKGTKIAVLDSGIDKSVVKNKPDQIKSYNLTEEQDGDFLGHGTAVASILLGGTSNSKMMRSLNRVIGICPNAHIIDVKITDKDACLTTHDVIMGLEMISTMNTDIILLGATTVIPTDGKDILSRFCDRLLEENQLIVCPAGNFGPDPNTIGTPGCSKSVITVGAIDQRLRVSFFSSRGSTSDERIKPDFVLPGTNIQVSTNIHHTLSHKTINQNRANSVSGTSISAAIFVGLLSLLLETEITISKHDILQTVREVSVSQFFDKRSEGFGLLDTNAFLEAFDVLISKPAKYSNIMKISAIFSIILCALLLILMALL